MRLLVVLVVVLMAASALAQTQVSFWHHSSGRNLIGVGSPPLNSSVALRDSLDEGINFWDHDYEYTGLRNADGTLVGWTWPYTNNEYTEHFPSIFKPGATGDPAALRDSLTTRFDLTIIKNCYPEGDITSEADLDSIKSRLTQIVDNYWGTESMEDKVLMYIGFPPRRLADTNENALGWALELRRWIIDDWVHQSPNLRYWDFYGYAMEWDTEDSRYGAVRQSYESTDSHLNNTGTTALCPIFAEYINNVCADLTDTTTYRLDVTSSDPEYDTEMSHLAERSGDNLSVTISNGASASYQVLVAAAGVRIYHCSANLTSLVIPDVDSGALDVWVRGIAANGTPDTSWDKSNVASQ